MASESLGNSADSTLTAKLNPALRYLRVQAQGQTSALLVLGYVDPDPQGDIEVWYSSAREVIKLQNGRIVSTTGLETNWRAVRFSVAPPAWSDAAEVGGTYMRLRDQMPGHRYALSDRLQLKPLAGVPNVQLPASLPHEQAITYRWFSETALNAGNASLPTSLFAWAAYRGQPTVVYSQQCLSATFCLTLQLWPVQEKSL
ncbi:MAG: YjbF family lipoprotein [Polaromonas sp.]|nr:YjbF family lipoprotein [Polaromonas sp.]